MTDSPEYTRLDDGRIAWQFSVSDDVSLIFTADNIRVGDTTPKAYIKIGIPGDDDKAISTVHLQEDREYSALSNRAALGLWGAKPTDPRAVALREHMMRYCDGLYEFWLGEESGEEVEGDKHPSAPPWAVPGLILDDSMGIWAGDRGANKSTLGRLACQSLRYGVDDVIPIVRKAMAIWVNAEEPDVEHKRQLGNINSALGLPRESDMYTVDARGMGIADLTPRVRDAVAKTDAKHVFIDSISRLAGGNDLNSNSTATMLMDAFGDMPASVTWLAHTGHEHKERMAGSRHFENAARLMVLVESRFSNGDMRNPELMRGVRTKVYKANGAVPTEPMYWTLGYHAQYGLTTAQMADKDDWPLLHCDFAMEKGDCGRRTWSGVTRYGVRCSRHLREEEEE